MKSRIDPVRIYVAAASGEIEEAERWMYLLDVAGWDVTSTWPDAVRAEGEGNPIDATLEARRGWAKKDADEVAQSHVLWMLMPPGCSHGAFWEFGYAHGRGIYTVVSGSGQPRSIFTALADEAVEKHEHAFARLAMLRHTGVYR